MIGLIAKKNKAIEIRKDSYPKLQSVDLLKFSSDYKDKHFNTDVFLDSNLDSNFEYNKLYPILERLFLRKYLRTIYKFQVDSSRFNAIDNQIINEYAMERIFTNK